MADQMFFEDGSFRWPATTRQFHRVPDDLRRYYRYDTKRQCHVLLKHVEEMFGPLRAQSEELETSIAEVPAKRARDMAALDRATIADALHSGLTARGVSSALARGAAAILRDSYALSVQKSGDERHVVAETAYGVFPVDALVEQFLSSEDGQPFAGKPVNPEPGYFASKLVH